MGGLVGQRTGSLFFIIRAKHLIPLQDAKCNSIIFLLSYLIINNYSPEQIQKMNPWKNSS